MHYYYYYCCCSVGRPNTPTAVVLTDDAVQNILEFQDICLAAHGASKMIHRFCLPRIFLRGTKLERLWDGDESASEYRFISPMRTSKLRAERSRMTDFSEVELSAI